MYAFMSDFIGICMRKLNWTDQTFAKPTLKDFIYELKCYEHLLVHNNDTTQVVVKKRFLGHSKKFQKIHKFSLLPAQNQQNSSELILIC